MECRKDSIISCSSFSFHIESRIEHRVLGYEKADILFVDTISLDEGEFCHESRICDIKIIEKFFCF